MRFFSVNKLVESIKATYDNVEMIDLLLNTKLFKEDKFGYMNGPILLLKVTTKTGGIKTLDFKQLNETLDDVIVFKIRFPKENNSQYLICTIDGDSSHSAFGEFHAKKFSKVGYNTQKKAQQLTKEYEDSKKQINDAVELFDGGEEL